MCHQFHREQVVCPPKLCGSVFTTAAINNIDLNTSATTAKESFHGTSISLLQHPSFFGDGIDRSIFRQSEEASSKKAINLLPNFFTDLQPITSNVKNAAILHSGKQSLSRDDFKQHRKNEYVWQEIRASRCRCAIKC